MRPDIEAAAAANRASQKKIAKELAALEGRLLPGETVTALTSAFIQAQSRLGAVVLTNTRVIATTKRTFTAYPLRQVTGVQWAKGLMMTKCTLAISGTDDLEFGTGIAADAEQFCQAVLAALTPSQ